MTLAPYRGTKADGPSFCWHCNRQLLRMGTRTFAFALVRDQAGIDHRVHGACVHLVTADDPIKVIQPAKRYP